MWKLFINNFVPTKGKMDNKVSSRHTMNSTYSSQHYRWHVNLKQRAAVYNQRLQTTRLMQDEFHDALILKKLVSVRHVGKSPTNKLRADLGHGHMVLCCGPTIIPTFREKLRHSKPLIGFALGKITFPIVIENTMAVRTSNQLLLVELQACN